MHRTKLTKQKIAKRRISLYRVRFADANPYIRTKS